MEFTPTTLRELPRVKGRSPPVSALGQGIALIPLISPPSGRGGWRADKAHGLDRQAGCGTARGRALGVKRHAPRLAARQRASSAYASSTVGPTRSCLSLDGVARASPVGRFA